jgi:hypothetical protein
MSEYSQGVCEDGAAILKDGLPMTIEQILTELRSAQKPSAVVPEGLALVPAIATREIEDAIGRNRNLKASEIWEVAVSVASKNVQQPSAVVPDDSKHHAVMQAQMWAQEARTQKAIVKQIGEIVGCANDWEMVEAVKAALASAVVPEWISVDENLPIDVGQVLMIFGEPLFGTCNPTIETGYYDKESETWRFWTFDREVRGFGVTHWMKLPALPKQDSLN